MNTTPRKRFYPLPEHREAFVVLPEVWLGKHAQRRDAAIMASEKYHSGALTNFAVALALCENWGGIPGLDGPPDKWDFGAVDLSVMAWVIGEVLEDYNRCLLVPKGLYAQLPDGSTESQTETHTAGDSTETP